MAGTHFGKVCVKHPEYLGERKSANGSCLKCHRDWNDAWRAKNPEKAKNARRNWAKNNPDTVKEIALKSRQNNPGRIVANSRKREIAKLFRIPPWADLGKIKEIYDEAQSLDLTVDHVIPLQGELVSGLHVHNNLQLLTASENFSKGNKFKVE